MEDPAIIALVEAEHVCIQNTLLKTNSCLLPIKTCLQWGFFVLNLPIVGFVAKHTFNMPLPQFFFFFFYTFELEIY